ncbi:glycosyltransferase family 2 protein [Streptomyces durbertensis]|uniref:Glycosyltransferase family 2 protein n=1 Tax=Streptomyces durbertensis TaxID=2448886 RepID=A0ABR6EC43_9ACTN|nr:galactosyltransferase-related protein [Streptomyces durbertensis]MBB1242901.1 glycosyltransferase family 2 protein [Streptomyces durbertensis]
MSAAARPSDPAALAAAATSSLILVHDPAARAVGPDYWDWSADAHHATATALGDLDDNRVRAAVARLADDPSDNTAAAGLTLALTDLLRRPGGEGTAVDALRAAAARTESLSRLLVQPGAPGRPARTGEAPDTTGLLAALAREPHHGAHPVDAAVVIPFRAPDDVTGRVRNLAAVLNALADQSHPRDRYRVVVVESDARPRWRELFADACDSYVFAPDPGRFNKSWTVNVGVVHGARPAELVCVLDGDILVDRDFVARAVERFRQPGTQAHWPFEDMLFLDAAASAQAVRARCLDGAPDPGQDRLRGVHLRRPPGGCVWLREDLFTRIGGMDERFCGWGGEDQDFVWRAERYGPMDRHRDPLVHLHHDRAAHRGDDGTPFYEDVERAGFCSWPCDSDFGRIDRNAPQPAGA